MADEKKPTAPAATSPPGTPSGAAPQPGGAAPAAPTPGAFAHPAAGASVAAAQTPAGQPGPADSTQPQVTEKGDRQVSPITGQPPTAAPAHKEDPQGRVKQQDAAGNVLADENQIRREGTPQQPQAPAVHTDSRTNFTKRKIAELERQALDAESLQGTRRMQAVAQLRAQIRELRERESRTFGGADIRTPRGNILHAEEAIAQRPDFHYRFININAAGKAANALAQGYEKVSEDEGGKTLGDLALFRIPLERRAQVVAGQETKTKEDLKRVQDDLRGEVREMAKFARSRGIDVDERRLGVFSDNPEE